MVHRAGLAAAALLARIGDHRLVYKILLLAAHTGSLVAGRRKAPFLFIWRSPLSRL